jgi:cytochrome c553
MPFRKSLPVLLIALGVLVAAGLLAFWPTQDANAQCGSQASSCKNCHEVQGQDPVNNDGTGWHQSHAFGDFCYLCHAGNPQSPDEAIAHEGMVPPMSDVKAACQSCHPADLMERSEVYATALGVEIGTGDSSASTTGGSASTGGTDTSSPSSAPGMVVDTTSAVSDVIDYNQLYDETVLGVKTVNWGNVILWVLIAATALGGGAFVFFNERKLRGLPALPASRAKPAGDTPAAIIKVPGYSDEVAATLPLIAKLNPIGLTALNRLLENPEEANELLLSLSRLDPQLVRRVRNMDRDTRALLLALSNSGD